MQKPTSSDIRLAAIADLHFTVESETLRPLLEQVSEQADVLLFCGDLTDHGYPEEAEALARELSHVPIPMLGVLGNHDVEAERQDEIIKILHDAGLRILDGEAYQVHGVGFAGVKGFAGGFGRRGLAPWGEAKIKEFVQEVRDEALRLDSALAKLRTEHRVALLHYAPVRSTVEGEPPEIFAFLGSSHLEAPLDRHGVSVVFHGHAHSGSLEGRTQTGIPVWNVSMPLLRRLKPDEAPFHIYQLPAQPAETESPS